MKQVLKIIFSIILFIPYTLAAMIIALTDWLAERDLL